uniref:RNA helicase n=1 Tax=Gopherus evgoodei TaxID=1825980 RepID=A0A8C5F0P9_9SAUR
MSSAGKRRGRPNRGGGRGRGRGGGGGGRGRGQCNKSHAGGNKKGSSKIWDDGDDFCCFEEPPVAFRSSCVIRRGGQTKQRPETRMPLQTIHMTSENQQRVKELLQELQRQELSADSEMAASGEDNDDEPDYFDDVQCWSADDEISEVTTRVVSEPDEHKMVESEVSSFAVHKLSRYGFDNERCQTILRSCNGNIGASLEHLLLQCFSEKYGKRMQTSEAAVQASLEECLEQRQEEAFALRSIYGENFVERIKNRVWTFGLELEHLTNKVSKSKQRDTAAKDVTKQTLNKVCKFYLQGGCKFGTRCKFQHETPAKHLPRTLQNSVDDTHLRSNGDTSPLYELEIRFPEDNKYPYQAPVVAFYSTNENLPLACRLHIAEFLYGKALTSAEANEPVVYSLVTCLEDESEITELLTNTSHKYSVPPVSLLAMPSTRTHADGHKQVLPESSPVSNRMSEDTKESESESDEDEEEEEPETVVVENESYVNLKKKLSRKYDMQAKSVYNENVKICKQFRIKQSSRHFQSMLQERQNLPAWEERETILDLLAKHQVLVVSGMTGCGKTTQIPQFILDASLRGPPNGVANIICTQPRRISAISVAERVAKERTERVGITVGYQIRLESVKSLATRLLYCTTGVLLRRLEGDMTLQGITHVIVDEVHERTEERYVLEDGSPYMNNTKRGPEEKLKARRKRTALEEVEEDLRCARLLEDDTTVKDSVPDQQLTFKQLLIRYKGVSKSVLKTMAAMDLDKVNLELIESLLEWIVSGKHSYPPGAVLIFLPGLAEIKMLYEQLQSNALFSNRHSKRCVVYPLHSSLSSEDQQSVFLKPPVGVTKIIISTNIAETSITIDDVVFVIDSGKMKEKRYDPSKGMESLEDTFVSKANALQRKGRAGRVASGVCFHLFSSHHYTHQLVKQQLPEIQRVPLEQLCLRIKILDMFSAHGLQSVLSRLIEPPRIESLRASKLRLQDLGALTPDEKLTPLGYHLASLPVDVRIGKLMLFGTIFRCLDPALTIAASLAFKSPFVSPWDKREEANKKKLEFAIGNSDYLALLQAYKGWRLSTKESSHASYSYCRENFLSGRVLQEMASLKRQFTELLSDIGFVKEGLRARDMEKRWSRGDGVLDATGEEANSNAENIKLISAILCAALYPNVVQVKTPEGKYQYTSAGAVKLHPKAEELKFVTKNDGYVHIHPSSVNYQTRHFDSPYLVYHEKIKTSRVFIRDCSMVSVYPLVLFGGGQVHVQLQRGEFVISLDDGWIRFAAASHQVAELVKELRCELDQLLQDKIKNPSMDLCTCPRGSRIISMIVKLVTTQ